MFLSKGLKQLGDLGQSGLAEFLRLFKGGITNPNILIGIALEAAFFSTLLFLISKADVSFIWPLTSLGFVLTTLAAQFILREQVSALRWSGVVLIVFGVALISWSEQIKRNSPSADPPSISP